MMILRSSLAALLFTLAVAQESIQTSNVAESTNVTEEVLVRCRRPLCSKLCEFGEKLDSAGCPRCECLADPCEEASCPLGKVCVRKDHCEGHPCDQLNYTCTDYPCPQVMCSRRCKFGMEKNKYGCDTCTCKKNPCKSVECLAEEQCRIVDDLPKCVANPPAVIEEPMLPKCSLVQCRMFCRFGFAKNEDGCEICRCKTNVCQGVQCGRGEKCTQDLDFDCTRRVCRPKCTLKPLCEHMRDDLIGADEVVATGALECDAEGQFVPRQCHSTSGDCWCVNDMGLEVEGTRRSADHPNGKPSCSYNKTLAVDGHLELQHDIDKELDHHRDQLKVVLTRQLGEWLMVKEDYIQEVSITPSGDEEVRTMKVDFVLQGDVEEDLDLASSVNHLRLVVESEETIIQYQDFTLKPVPHSMQAQHHFHTLPYQDEVWVCRFYRDHRTGVVAALLGLLLLVFTVSVLALMVVKKRKLAAVQREEQYKQNLSFTNEVYGRLAFLDEVTKEKNGEPGADSNEAIA